MEQRYFLQCQRYTGTWQGGVGRRETPPSKKPQTQTTKPTLWLTRQKSRDAGMVCVNEEKAVVTNGHTTAPRTFAADQKHDRRAAVMPMKYYRMEMNLLLVGVTPLVLHFYHYSSRLLLFTQSMSLSISLHASHLIRFTLNQNGAQFQQIRVL